MRKTLFVVRLASSALCALSLFWSLQAYGQEREPRIFRGRGAAQEEDREMQPSNVLEQEDARIAVHPNGIVQDWSTHHVVYPRFGAIQSMIALQRQPRALLSWQAASRRSWQHYNNFRTFHHTHTSIHTDWSISLGSGTTAPAMYPAKFTFDPSAIPNCATDFIVFPVNVTGGAGQPNMVGLNNLYSGTTTGICNRGVSSSDDGVSATTMWSYNIHAAGGQVSTSPALSLDGTKVAFVETASATPAHLHVLAWRSGDGKDASNLQSVLSPVTINSGFAISAPVAGSGTTTDLVLGSTSDTLSSPFVDYNNDFAYIGNDSGTLFRVINIFCTTPACTGGGSPAPSLDASWGIAGALATGCPGKLSGAVVDPLTGNILVGCTDGNVYGFTTGGAATSPATRTVGNGSATGGIVDPPLIDAVRGFMYVESGNSAGGTAVLSQIKTDMSSIVTATLAAGGSFNMHAPAFNDNYFSNLTSSTWLLYALAPDNPGGNTNLYGITFNGSHVMTSGAPANLDSSHIGAFEISPATEFLTTSGSPEDRLFESVLTNIVGNLVSYNISITFPSGLENFAPAQGSGTTGIVVDNTSALGQADSIYFGALVANTAVKLTQSGLN